MGANIHGTERNTAPLFIEPVERLHSIQYTLPVPSAQVKSSLLFAGLFADNLSTIIESTKNTRSYGTNAWIKIRNNKWMQFS